MKSLILVSAAIIIAFMFSAFSLKAQPWMQGSYLNPAKKDAGFYDVKKAFNDWSAGKDLKNIKGFKAYKRWEWFWEPRVYPNGKIPVATLYLHESNKVRNHNVQKSIMSNIWSSVSPNQIPESRDTNDIIGMGRINCIAFHPSDTNIIYVGASQGGVWKSVDGGLSWVSLTDDIPVLRVSGIAVNPLNPDVIYIATGDIDDIAFNPVSAGRPYSFGIGILKTTNGGTTWDTTGLTFNLNEQMNTLIRKIIINPVNPNELLVGAYSGTWKSQDAGANWTQTSNYRVIDMDENPLNYRTIYACTFYNNVQLNSKRIYKSFDFGETWNELTTGMPIGTTIARVELALTKADTNYAYAITCKPDGGMYGIYKTVNSGNTWIKLSNVPNVLGWADGGKLNIPNVPKDSVGQGWYDLTIVVDPTNKNKVYTGGVNMWGSSDGGSNWNIVSMWVKYLGNSIHADQHYSIFNPLNNVFYQANDGGIYKTYSLKIGSLEQVVYPPPFGLGCVDLVNYTFIPGCYSLPTVWNNLGHGIHNTEFYKLGLSRSNPTMYIAGAQDNGTYLYKNGSWINTLGGDGMEAMIAHENDNVMYATNYNGALSRTDDGGINYISGLDSAITGSNEGNESGDWVTPYLMNPNYSDTLYGGFNNVWMSPDKGNSWTKLGNNSGTPYKSLAVSKSNTNYIYASRGTNVYKTTDRGTTWQNITNNLPCAEVMNTYLAVDATDPLKAYATFSGYMDTSKVYVTINGGTSWKNISAGLPNVPVNCIVRNDNNSSDIYVGTDIGVFFTNDYLLTTPDKWIYYSDGLPNVIVNELEIHYSAGKLRAATYGRGLWEVDLCAAPEAIYSFVANNLSVDFTNQSLNATSYLWDFGDGDTSSLPNPQHNFLTDGNYLVKLYTINDCSIDSSEINIQVTCNLADALFIWTANYLTVNFTNQSTGAISYEWQFGDNSTSSSQDPQHVYQDTGNYVVKLIAVNSCGTDTFVMNVLVVSGIPENNIYDVQVYPNPVKNKLFIDFKGTASVETVDIRMIDITGKLIFEKQTLSHGIIEIPVIENSSGVYIIEISGDSAIQRLRVEVE